jgi:pyruvate dehydrogenase E1 component alpha subunit
MAGKDKARGAAVAEELPADKPSFSLISNEKLTALYATMVKCRMLEERARVVFKQSKITGNYDAVGREACVVGTAIDLDVEDTIGISHRDFITNFVKGAPLEKMFCQLYARAANPGKGRSSPAPMGYATADGIAPSTAIAAQCNIAAGVALANKMRKNGKIAVAYSDNRARPLGLWHEALNFAGARGLPILFVVEDDTRAELAALKDRRRVEDIAEKAHAYGFPGIAVDGNDVVAVYRVAYEAIARARQGRGPTLIECKTYRRHGHSGIDPAKYRDAAEVERWKANDPIANMEKYLGRKGLFAAEMKQKIVEGFNKELDAAIAYAKKTPHAGGIEALDDVYSFSVREWTMGRKKREPKH